MVLLQLLNQPGAATKYFAPDSSEYLLQVYLPIAIWLLIVFLLFIFLLRKFTFGKWTKENPNPHAGETLDMPRGTFRGIITLSLLFVAIRLELLTIHIQGFEEQIHEFMVAFQMMLAFYFGSKVMHHMTSSEKAKTEIKAEAHTTVSTAQVQSMLSEDNKDNSQSSDFDNIEAAG